MTDVATAMLKLDGYGAELDQLSQKLSEVGRRLEPVAKEYRETVMDFEAAMYERYEKGEGKWPGAEFREGLARRVMDTDLRDRYDALTASSKRMQDRIGELKKLVEVQRSILSAEKTILEAER